MKGGSDIDKEPKFLIFAPLAGLPGKPEILTTKKYWGAAWVFPTVAHFLDVWWPRQSRPAKSILMFLDFSLSKQSKFKYILKITPKVRYRQRGYSASNKAGWPICLEVKLYPRRHHHQQRAAASRLAALVAVFSLIHSFCLQQPEKMMLN